LIFSTLALIFRSFRQTLIIIFSIPFALTGTFLGFFLCNMVFSADAAVGIVSLAGIAVNDAIVLIDTMNQYRRQGLSIKDAASKGAGDRLRPVLSTSLTTIVGLVPLALSDPEWAPLCYTIIFGLVASTLITLYVIPALYLLFTPKRRLAAEAECDAMLEEGSMSAEG
jgi:multidrug efflux pump subunit AcrB